MTSRNPTAARWALAAACLLVALAGCARGAGEDTPARGTAADVAVRAGDLPPGMLRCAYAGSIESYLSAVAAISTDTAASTRATWTALQKAGATEGYYAVYADTLRACRYFVTGAPEGHTPGGVRLVATIVARFEDPAAAAAAFDADLFGQSHLRVARTGTIREGERTGLGPNAVAVVDDEGRPRTGQAVWQTGSFNLFLRAQNLTGAQIDELAGALSGRAA